MRNSGKRCLTDGAMNGEPKDRISYLPITLLEDIVAYLPLHDAIRTCILSRRWRYIWARLSLLDFDEEFFQWLLQKGLNSRSIASIISDILLLHTGPILQFHLSPPEELVSCLHDHIDKWILFLSRNGVQVLDLTGSPQGCYRLGSSFFSCSELDQLLIKYYIFEPPSSFKGFQCLTFLDLYCVSIKSNTLEALISCSTLLEVLSLRKCPGISTVNIRASNIKMLLIVGAFESITLSNTANLVDARLWVQQTGNHPVQKKMNSIEVCGSMPRFEKLFLSDPCLGIFAADGIPTKFPTELLKHLVFSGTTFSEADEFSCALRLIGSLRNLQELEIEYSTFEFCEETHLEVCTLDKLQIVRMIHIMVLSPELDLIKFLLASAPQLVSMFVRRDIDITPDAEVTLSRALMRYPRASPKAKIEYLEPVDDD